MPANLHRGFKPKQGFGGGVGNLERMLTLRTVRNGPPNSTSYSMRFQQLIGRFFLLVLLLFPVLVLAQSRQDRPQHSTQDSTEDRSVADTVLPTLCD